MSDNEVFLARCLKTLCVSPYPGQSWILLADKIVKSMRTHGFRIHPSFIYSIELLLLHPSYFLDLQTFICIVQIRVGLVSLFYLLWSTWWNIIEDLKWSAKNFILFCRYYGRYAWIFSSRTLCTQGKSLFEIK